MSVSVGVGAQRSLLKLWHGERSEETKLEKGDPDERTSRRYGQNFSARTVGCKPKFEFRRSSGNVRQEFSRTGSLPWLMRLKCFHESFPRRPEYHRDS